VYSGRLLNGLKRGLDALATMVPFSRDGQEHPADLKAESYPSPPSFPCPPDHGLSLTVLCTDVSS
jgi:hypothetical protein